MTTTTFVLVNTIANCWMLSDSQGQHIGSMITSQEWSAVDDASRLLTARGVPAQPQEWTKTGPGKLVLR